LDRVYLTIGALAPEWSQGSIALAT
jgi:hypothetical protein